MQPLRIPSRRGGHLVLLACPLVCLLAAQSCGGDEVAPVPPAEDQGAGPEVVLEENGPGAQLTESATSSAPNRHALHGGALDAKGVDIHEVRASLSVLMVMGEKDPHAFVEILSELATVGTDAAAALALELEANPRLKFDGRDTAFSDLFRALLRFDAITDQRAALEAALVSQGSSDSDTSDSE